MSMSMSMKRTASQTAPRIVVTVLGTVFLGLVINLALPVQAGEGKTTANTDEVLCVKHTVEGVIVGSCVPEGRLASFINSSAFRSIQTDFREPIY